MKETRDEEMSQERKYYKNEQEANETRLQIQQTYSVMNQTIDKKWNIFGFGSLPFHQLYFPNRKWSFRDVDIALEHKEIGTSQKDKENQFIEETKKFCSSRNGLFQIKRNEEKLLTKCLLPLQFRQEFMPTETNSILFRFIHDEETFKKQLSIPVTYNIRSQVFNSDASFGQAITAPLFARLLLWIPVTYNNSDASFDQAVTASLFVRTFIKIPDYMRISSSFQSKYRCRNIFFIGKNP